jgi:hypothetical protein
MKWIRSGRYDPTPKKRRCRELSDAADRWQRFEAHRRAIELQYESAQCADSDAKGDLVSMGIQVRCRPFQVWPGCTLEAGRKHTQESSQ